MSLFKENLKANTSIKVLQRCIPTITISPDALIKMQLFVENCTDEVGWLGTAYKNEKENNIYINDVFLFDQEVHSTTTEITPEGLSSFAEEILQEENGMEIWNNLKVWGHSHVNMSVSPSGQDDNQMSTFADGGHDWFIRIIANKKGDMRVDLYNYTLGVIYNELPWFENISDEELEIEKQIAILRKYLEEIKGKRIKIYEDYIKEEIKEKVKKKVYTQTGNITYWNKQKEKDTVTPITTITKNTQPYTDTDGDKKKVEEIKKENEKKSSSETEEDRIEDDIAVYSWFNYDDLLDIGDCEDIDQVASIMYQYGYYGIFDELELKVILKTAHDVRAHYYKI